MSLRLALLGCLLAVACMMVAVADLPDPSAVRKSVAGIGPAAVAIAVAVYGACTLAPVPRNVMSTGTGAVFGFWWGVPLVYAGSLVSAGAAFWLARWLGRQGVGRIAGRRTAALNDLLARRGFASVLGARLAPVVPFTAFNYAAGLTDLRWLSYWWATVVGVVPGSVAYVAVGAYAVSVPTWWLAALVATALLVAAGNRRRWPKLRSGGPHLRCR